MPYSFDTAHYKTNYNPLQGFGVSVQDVMAAWGDVFQEIINLLPQLLSMIEALTPEQIIQIVQTGLDQLLGVFFPTDGSTSPIVGAVITALAGAAAGADGNLIAQIINIVISLATPIVNALLNIGGSGGNPLLDAINTLTGNDLSSQTGLFGPVVAALTGTSGPLSGLTSWASGLAHLGSIAITDITGIAAGILTWLTSGGALPGGTTLSLGGLTGLATGFATWLASGGALPSGSTLGVGGLTGLATGFATWLASGGALPSGVSATISQITALAGYLTNLNTSGNWIGTVAQLGLATLLTYLDPATGHWSGGVSTLGLSTILGKLSPTTGAWTGSLADLGAGLVTLLTYLDPATGNWTGNLATLGATIGGYFAHLSSAGVLALSGLASGALPSGITMPLGQVSGILAAVATWLASGGALPTGSTLGLSGITGLATGFATWLAAGGALPSGVTAAVGQLTGLATGFASWLTAGGAVPSGVTMGAGALTGLATGILTWLSSGGELPTATTLALTKLGSGALPSGITMPLGQLSGLATGFATWLAAGGALPTGVTAGVSQLTGLATGFATWLASGGALPTGSTLGAGGLTGLATGILTWLTGGGALPGATTLGAGGLTGLATGIGTWLTAGGALPTATTLAVSKLTGAATGMLTWLGSGGALPTGSSLAATAITAGALAAGITLPTSQLTSIATGMATWLSAGGALPSATTLGASGLTGLAAGILTWLTGGGALPSGSTLGAGALTGLAAGIGSWLTGGGALPAATTLALSGLTGLATGISTWLAGGGALPAATTLATSQLSGLVTLAMTSGVAGIDALVNAWGGPSSGNTLANLATFAQQIPHEAVLGNLGPSTAGQTWQAIMDYGVQGVMGTATTGNGLPDFGNALGQLASFLGFAPNGTTPATSVAGLAQGANSYINNRAITKASDEAIDPTADSTFDITNLTATTAPTVAVTPIFPLMGNIGTPDGGIKESVWWYAPATPPAGVTYVGLTVYQVNTTTGAKTQLWTSGNVLANCVAGWCHVNIPAANYITAQPGNWYCVEMAIDGIGASGSSALSYNILGINGHFLVAHPTAIPASIGELRDSFFQWLDSVSNYGGGHVASGSWTHTPGSYANTAADAVYVIFNVNGGSITSCKYGTATMTAVTTAEAFGGTIFELVGTPGAPLPSGAQTVSFTCSTTCYMAACAVSINNCSGHSTIVNGSGGSGTITAGVGQLILFGTGSSTVNSSTWSGLTDIGYEVTGQVGAISSHGPLLVGLTPGNGAAQTIAATNSLGSQRYAAVVIGSTVPAPPAVIGSPIFTNNIPWFSLGGSAPTPPLNPVPWQKNTAGTVTYTVPTQYQYLGAKFDIVVLGGGRGGYPSVGGSGGNFATPITLTYGVDIPLGTTTFSVTVGSGSAGTNSGVSAAGGNSSVTITGYGTITGTGGSGNTGGNNGGNTVPASVTLNGTVYQGGLGGSTGYQNGNPPGGGGGAGTAGFTAGGSGSRGSVWITAHQ